MSSAPRPVSLAARPASGRASSHASGRATEDERGNGAPRRRTWLRAASWLAPVLAAVALAACGSSSEEPDLDSTSPDIEGDSERDGGASADAADREPTQDGDGGEVGVDAAIEPNRFVDDCDMAASACTGMPANYAVGKGLAPLDRCAFALTESAGLGAPVTLVEALAKFAPRTSVEAVVADGNRDAIATTTVPGNPPGVSTAFRWNAEDYASERWIPQGVSGSADGDATGMVGGKRVVLVSFYDSDETAANKGSRIAFVDTSKSPPAYRFVMLVTPSGTPAAPSFVPVKIHAGGIVWYGDYLYVADTSRGFRVFDMKSILKVDTNVDSIGCANGICRAGLYKYVLPQVGTYGIASVTTACKPRFSFVSLDRSTDPPSLLSGEYCASTACSAPLAGRVFRWPLDAAGSRLRSAKTFPTEAFYMGQVQVQGAASLDGTYFLSSSAPAGTAGALYRVKGAKSATSTWSDGPEDLMIDRARGLLFSASEHANARTVFGARLTSYPAP